MKQTTAIYGVIGLVLTAVFTFAFYGTKPDVMSELFEKQELSTRVPASIPKKEIASAKASVEEIEGKDILSSLPQELQQKRARLTQIQSKVKLLKLEVDTMEQEHKSLTEEIAKKQLIFNAVLEGSLLTNNSKLNEKVYKITETVVDVNHKNGRNFAKVVLTDNAPAVHIPAANLFGRVHPTALQHDQIAQMDALLASLSQNGKIERIVFYEPSRSEKSKVEQKRSQKVRNLLMNRYHPKVGSVEFRNSGQKRTASMVIELPLE